MCGEAINNCLAVLKFVPNSFFPGKMLERFHDTLQEKDDILF